MSTTTVITQPRAQPPLASEAAAAPHAAQPDEQRLAVEQSVADDQTATTRPAHSSAVSRSSGALTVVGVAALAGATVFGIGWLWRDLGPVWRKLTYNIADIRIPVALPVAIGEVWWDFLTDRRAMSQQTWRLGGATSDSANARGRAE